jgi:hypothetical protein
MGESMAEEEQQKPKTNTIELSHGNIEAMKVKLLGDLVGQVAKLNQNMIQLQVVLAEVLKEPLVLNAETGEKVETPAPGS